MTRVIKDPKWHGSADGAADAVLPYREQPDWEDVWWRFQIAEEGEKRQRSPSRMMREKPWKAGDIILSEKGVCRVLGVHPEWLEGRGYFIPQYRLQHVTARGEWSRVFHNAWPGDIFRAYRDAGLITDEGGGGHG